ncbi:hypothetical protein AB0M43_36210 [Longispora sp. NPDC051575]|uniref:hypothetical protein n=1 Tax=Longispora sp. NPDC051575 TaxID=3154943 RepID=UPI00341A3C6F
MNDSDIQQADLDVAGDRIHRLRRSGWCAHPRAVSYLDVPVYVEQQGLRPGQVRCTTGCRTVFADDAAWIRAQNDDPVRLPSS